MNANLYAHIQAQAPADRSAIVVETDDGRRFSWDDLDRRTARVAALLDSLGASPGDRVAAQVEKSAEALFLYLGTLRAGCTYLPLNTAYQRHELGYFIADAEPRVVVCGGAALESAGAIARDNGVPHVFTLEGDGSGSLADALAGQPESHPTREVGADDLAAIIYTSGTTGRSKGAMVTHGNLTSNGYTLRDHWGFSRDDVLIHALPLFHVHGLFVACHCALLAGARMILRRKFDPAAVLADFARATVLMGVPTFYVRLLGEAGLDAQACKGMRLFISGSAPLLAETHVQFRERTGQAILERYGMSEAGMITSNPLRGERRAGTVGPALPGIRLRISDEGRELPRGQVGAIEIQGPNVFKGYWRMPEKTAEDFTADGWFRTGDVGLVDADGYVSIVGRAKDLVITGGYNVYPKELELLIDELPGVLESAVIGVPHPDFGEAVTAVVVAKPGMEKPTEAGIIAALKSTIAAYKVPKRVYVVDELPRNTMGKVQKNVLRERYGKG